MKKEKNVKPQKRPTVAPQKTAKPGITFPTEFFEKNGIYLLAGGILTMLLILFSQYILDDRIFLFKDTGGDSINFNWPSHYLYSQYLRHEGIPKWSFSQGLGQNVFPALLGDVPSWLLYFVSPANLAYMFVYVEVIKFSVAALFFYLFLRKINFSTYAALLGAAMYTFTGFMTVGSTWLIFPTEAAYLAMLLYGIEAIRKDNNWLVFPIAVALAASNNPVVFYLDSLLIVSYLAVTFILNGFTKSSALFLVKAIGLGSLGLGIAAFLMLGNIQQFVDSPRGSESFSYTKTLSSKPIFKTDEWGSYRTFLQRMLSNEMPGHTAAPGRNYMGWKNYLEDPMQYCSLLSLLLVPQLFVFAGKRLKILAGACLAIAIIPVLFPYFRYAFWLFSGDYFRTYSLFFDILQIVLALVALELILKQKRINIYLLLASVLFIAAIVFTGSNSPDEVRVQVMIFALAEAVLIWMVTSPAFGRVAYWMLPLALVLEILVLTWPTFNDRSTIRKSELETRMGYNDYTNEAVQLIKKHDNGFYRVFKNYPSSVATARGLNDAMIQNYYGYTSYHPFNQKNYVRFMEKMRMISGTNEAETRWIEGLEKHLVLLRLFSHKYVITPPPLTGWAAQAYDTVDNTNGLFIMHDRLSVPLGITYDAVITESEMEKVSAQKKDFLILKAAVITDADSSLALGMKYLTAADTVGWDTQDLVPVYEGLKKDSFKMTTFSQNHIEGTVNPESKKVLFFSFPYDKGWHCTVDGKPTEAQMVNFGFMGFVLDKGGHKIVMDFEPRYYTAGMHITEISILLYLILLAVNLYLSRDKIFKKKEKAEPPASAA